MPAKVVIQRKERKRIFEVDHLKKVEAILKNHLPDDWTYKRKQVPIVGWYFWTWSDGWLLERPGDRVAVARLRMDTRQILAIDSYIDQLKDFANRIADEIDDTVLLTAM